MNNNPHQEEEDDEEEENNFNRLPDALLLFIFNKLFDAKTLIRCSLVSKRFASLTSQIDTISIPLKDFSDSHPSLAGGIFKNLLNNIVTKFMGAPISCTHDRAPYDAVFGLNKHFQEIKSLQVELFYPHKAKHLGGLAKWKAVIGSRFEVCIILLAMSFRRTSPFTRSSNSFTYNEKEELEEADLKYFCEATYSCLANASAMHHLVQQVVSDHPMLRNVVVSDDGRQGKLCMGEEELACLRNNSHVKGELEIGPLLVQLWYVPVLDLPSGYGMGNVVLAVVRLRQADRPVVMERDLQLLVGAFDDEELGVVYDEAVMKLVNNSNKTTHVLEIPGFTIHHKHGSTPKMTA